MHKNEFNKKKKMQFLKALKKKKNPKTLNELNKTRYEQIFFLDWKT